VIAPLRFPAMTMLENAEHVCDQAGFDPSSSPEAVLARSLLRAIFAAEEVISTDDGTEAHNEARVNLIIALDDFDFLA